MNEKGEVARTPSTERKGEVARTRSTESVLLAVAGYLRLIVQGLQPSRDEAKELIEKIEQVL